ncbi:MAG: molybdopterin cofactor-binding domain-containing protein, partial [Sphaerochaetaceae bacterium]
DKESAENAAELVKVEYERLKPIFTMEEAKDEKGVFIHDKTNVLSELHISRGDIEKGFKEADVIVQNTITLPAIEHAYLEPDSVYAHIQDDGLLAVYTQSQSSFSFRDEIAANLALPADKIRVVTKATGGAFGGREEPTIQVHAALGALVTKQPVRMVMSRYDVMLRTSKRHAEILKYKLGAKKNGKFTAFQADILADTGAYPSAGEAVILRSVLFSSGPYEIENADVHGLCVYTNTTPAGAMRGFGSNQPAVASEIIIDMLAEKLNIDPFEIRMINALDVDKKTIGGQYLTASIGVKESLLEVQKALAKEKLPKLENYKVGIGIASAMKNVGLGSGMIDSAGAGAVLGKENLILKVASVDSGQGSDTVVRQVAAEILKVNPYTIELIANDTLLNLDGGVTTASRQTYVTGNAVKQASILLKEKILDKAASLLKIETKELDFSDYKIKRSGLDETLLTTKELFNAFGEIETSYIYTAPNTTPVSRYTDNPTLLDEEFRLHFSYCFGTQAAIVAVNPTNGDVKVLKVIAAHDTGKVINLHGVEGQIEGGIVMGMGYALSEKYVMDATGVLTDTLRKIGVPTIDQTPEMETILIENEQPGGPFGAKGLGELSMIPTTPAIINGIYDALKIRINDLPATPDKIVEKLTSTTKK